MQETISLYLDLREGEKADFEVVGLAAAAFADAVREIAFILEPGVEIKLEFDSGTKGSLSLNAIIKTSKKFVAKHSTLIVIILAVGGWFTNDLRQYGVQKFLDKYLTDEQRHHLTEEDIERISRALKNVMDGKLAKEPVQKVYREIERDDAILAVGTVTTPGTKPESPVPRERFLDMSGVIPIETSPKARKRIIRERLTLISPVLLPKPRIWRFHNGVDEFGYSIKDEKFLNSLLSGRRRIPMKAGIQISATVETHEEYAGNVWIVKERWITDVSRVHRARNDPDLFSEPKPKKRKSGKSKKGRAN